MDMEGARKCLDAWRIRYSVPVLVREDLRLRRPCRARELLSGHGLHARPVNVHAVCPQLRRASGPGRTELTNRLVVVVGEGRGSTRAAGRPHQRPGAPERRRAPSRRCNAPRSFDFRHWEVASRSIGHGRGTARRPVTHLSLVSRLSRCHPKQDCLSGKLPVFVVPGVTVCAHEVPAHLGLASGPPVPRGRSDRCSAQGHRPHLRHSPIRTRRCAVGSGRRLRPGHSEPGRGAAVQSRTGAVRRPRHTHDHDQWESRLRAPPRRRLRPVVQGRSAPAHRPCAGCRPCRTRGRSRPHRRLRRALSRARPGPRPAGCRDGLPPGGADLRPGPHPRRPRRPPSPAPAPSSSPTPSPPAHPAATANATSASAASPTPAPVSSAASTTSRWGTCTAPSKSTAASTTAAPRWPTPSPRPAISSP